MANTTLVELTDNELLETLNAEMAAATLPVSIYVGIEAVSGFVGNLVVLYVFAFHYHTCNFRYFVLSLALIDLLSTLSTVPLEIVTQRFWYTYSWPMICKVKSFLNVFTVSSEAFCLFIIAVDRYRKVCQPLRRQISPTVAKILCSVIFVAAFALAFPTAIFWGVHSSKKVYKGRTITVSVCEKDHAYVHSPKPLQFITTVEALIGVFLFVMFSLYAFIARQLIAERRRTSSGKFHRDNASTVRPRIATDLPSRDLSADNPAYVHPDLSSNEYGSTSDSASKFDAIQKQSGKQNAGQADLNTRSLSVGVTFTNCSPAKDSPQTDTSDNASVRTNDLYRKRTSRRGHTDRVRTKTKIMLILTTFFVITCIMYLTMLDIIARSGEVLEQMSFSGKAAYFTFFRFVFLNHVINPIIYGCLDAKFKKGVSNLGSRFVNFFSKG